jgi:hypothetical protein
VVPLVIVTVPPLIEHPPETVIATARFELAVAATEKVALYAALEGAALVTVMVCEAGFTVCASADEVLPA